MQIYIDQSSKIEQTSQDTVIAYSNGKQKSLLIRAHDKRSVREYFRNAGKPNIFVLRTFAVLIFSSFGTISNVSTGFASTGNISGKNG